MCIAYFRRRSNCKSGFVIFLRLIYFLTPLSWCFRLIVGPNFLKIFVQVPAETTLKQITLHSNEIAQINLSVGGTKIYDNTKMFFFLKCLFTSLSNFFLLLSSFSKIVARSEDVNRSITTDNQFMNFFWREKFCTLVTASIYFIIQLNN